MKKARIKIPVKHYIEITDTAQLNGVQMSEEVYLTNEGGKQYLVEVWRAFQRTLDNYITETHVTVEFD